MNTFDAISRRYSHKEGFLSDPVPLEDLQRIARAGIEAPSGANRQTVRLVILPDRDALDPVSAVTPTYGLNTAPAAIVVMTDKTLSDDRNNFEKEDYSAAVQNMLLGAVALGYASLWLDSPYFEAQKQREVRDALGLPEKYHIWAVLPIGKPDGEGSRREKLPLNERVFYRHYSE